MERREGNRIERCGPMLPIFLAGVLVHQELQVHVSECDHAAVLSPRSSNWNPLVQIFEVPLTAANVTVAAE
jgi:hypothetical protein